MDGSGDGGLSYTYILSAKMEDIDRAIIWAIYQVNTMKCVAAMEQQTKTTVIVILFTLCGQFVVNTFYHNDSTMVLIIARGMSKSLILYWFLTGTDFN